MAILPNVDSGFRKGCLFVFLWFGLASQSYALDCGNVYQLVSTLLKVHFSHHSFNDEISKRTLDIFIKSWGGWGKECSLPPHTYKRNSPNRVKLTMRISCSTLPGDTVGRSG